MTDIASLFSKDPSTLTDDELEAIIEKFRQSYNLFQTTGQTGKTPTAKEKKASENVGKVDLSSLGL